MRIPIPYVAYGDLKEYIDNTETKDDTLLRRLCDRASRVWEELALQRCFYPRSEVRYFDHPEDDDSVLKMDDDLLEVSAFTTANGSESISSSDYFLMCGLSYNLTPYNRIAMKRNGTHPNLWYSGTVQQANAVTGTWGYREDWSNAWWAADTIQDESGITAAGTSITVADADGTDLLGLTPRFRVQQLLKIGSEYLYVTATDTSSNKLTVVRGVNGTTAAIHENGTAIYTYQVQAEIVHWVSRLAGFLYRQRDSSVDSDRPIQTGFGGVILPSMVPKEILNAAMGYRRQG